MPRYSDSEENEITDLLILEPNFSETKTKRN